MSTLLPLTKTHWRLLHLLSGHLDSFSHVHHPIFPGIINVVTGVLVYSCFSTFLESSPTRLHAMLIMLRDNWRQAGLHAWPENERPGRGGTGAVCVCINLILYIHGWEMRFIHLYWTTHMHMHNQRTTSPWKRLTYIVMSPTEQNTFCQASSAVLEDGLDCYVSRAQNAVKLAHLGSN